jgi:hypothetical protein
MRHLLALALIASLSAEDAPMLDRLELSNGRALVGMVESETADAYTIHLAGGSGGAIIVAKSKVVTIVRRVEDMPVAPVPRPAAAKEPEAVASAAEPPQPVVEKPGRTEHIRELKAAAKAAGVTVSKAMFDEVKPGMTAKDVAEIMGPSSTQSAVGNSIIAVWQQPDGTQYRVTFSNGSVGGTDIAWSKQIRPTKTPR